MEEKEFDATLGGTEHLPFVANSLKFASSRSIEIAAMTESILRPSKTKLIFQTLPVHMRRRVMSHNTKRLPRKLREGHLEQLKKSGLPPKQKRPSRKYRRRPTNLLQEYTRRQRRHKWLETHIWHAKRFHMIERWGYRLPHSPCDKAFRACYRASSSHCLLQDMSYYVPIRLSGPIVKIQNAFKSITSNECSLSITAKAYLSGSREGFVHIFHKNKYPFGYIGKLSFTWESNHTSDGNLWLFVHPAHLNEIESLLTEVFEHKYFEDSSLEAPMKRIKLNSNDNCKVNVLQGCFNRFRLTGPKSHAVLVRSLKCISDVKNISNEKWITNTLSQEHLNIKYEYWKNICALASPSQLPPRIIIGLIVKDPRLSRPNKRTKATIESSTVTNPMKLVKIPQELALSPLWDTNIHKDVKDNMLSNHQFIEHVAKTQLVPGELNEDDPDIQKVPVILIQNPGSQDATYKKLGYGCSWDIIVPSGYGLPFWQTFIMFGGRSGGLRETENLSFERGECYLAPDSKAGAEDETRMELELKEKYFKRPPSKRVNFIKYGVNSPFKCQWRILLNDWCDTNIEDFFVLRDTLMLKNFQECLEKKAKVPNYTNSDSCLVPVYIQMDDKGKISKNAMIFIPQPCDLQSLVTIVEPQHKDNNETVRKQARKAHLVDLKRKRRRFLKHKKKGTIMNPGKLSKQNKKEPSTYVKEMRELWLPSNISNVRNNGTRELMGYLAQAAFSFSEAKSCGIGYIAYNALQLMLKNSINRVLIRNTTSRKYRCANIKVII